MAKKDAWLAYETSTTTGEGPYQLSGEPFGPLPAGHHATTFANALNDGDETVYVAHGDGLNFEVNLGTFGAAANELTRDQHLFTTNGGNSINWASGTKGIYAIQDPILSAAFLQAANNLSDVNDVITARDNLGLGTMAEEAAADYVDKRANDQAIDGTVLRLLNTGFVSFFAGDDATAARARYGYRTGAGDGAIAHHDGAGEIDIVRFDQAGLDFMSSLTNTPTSGLAQAVNFLRVGLTSNQTTDIDPGDPIVFNNSLDNRGVGNGFTLNTGTGVFTVPPGLWLVVCHVRILTASNTQGFGQFAVRTLNNQDNVTRPMAAKAQNLAAFENNSQDAMFGVIDNTSSFQFTADITNQQNMTAINAAETQMLVAGFRR